VSDFSKKGKARGPLKRPFSSYLSLEASEARDRLAAARGVSLTQLLEDLILREWQSAVKSGEIGEVKEDDLELN